MRALVLLLVLANGLFFAWSQGWLDGVAGVRAGGDREPERLALQVRPDAIRVLSPQAAAALVASAAAASAAASAALPAASAASQAASAASAVTPAASAASAVNPFACFEAGPFAASEVLAAEAALKAALPATRWVDLKTPRGGAWMIYMGKYPNRDAQTKKEEELNRIKVAFEEIAEPGSLGPGLSLGRFDARPAAEAALAQFARRGIRTAKVVELTAPVITHVLRIERADARLAETLKGLTAPALGRGFSACRPG